MTEIYVITTGEYEDYHIEAIYTSKYVAERLRGLGHHIEVWDADIEIGKLNAGFFPFNVYGWADEETLYATCLVPQPNISSSAVIMEVIDWAATDELRRKRNLEQGQLEPVMRLKFETWTWARSEEQALRRAMERKMDLLKRYAETGETKMEF